MIKFIMDGVLQKEIEQVLYGVMWLLDTSVISSILSPLASVCYIHNCECSHSLNRHGPKPRPFMMQLPMIITLACRLCTYTLNISYSHGIMDTKNFLNYAVQLQ